MKLTVAEEFNCQRHSEVWWTSPQGDEIYTTIKGIAFMRDGIAWVRVRAASVPVRLDTVRPFSVDDRAARIGESLAGQWRNWIAKELAELGSDTIDSVPQYTTVDARVRWYAHNAKGQLAERDCALRTFLRLTVLGQASLDDILAAVEGVERL